MILKGWVAVLIGLGLIMLAGCGGDGTSTSQATSPASSDSTTSATSPCGASGAASIAANLTAAGYEGVKVVDGEDEKFSRVLVRIPDVDQFNQAFVDVFCDENGAQAGADALAVKNTATSVQGSALYAVLGAPGFDPATGEQEPLPNLDRIVADLVTAGGTP